MIGDAQERDAFWSPISKNNYALMKEEEEYRTLDQLYSK
jgi:hypothetical protein